MQKNTLLLRSPKPNHSLIAAVVLACGLSAGCDVTNPGPVQDGFLSQAAAQPGLVNGAARQLSETYARLAFHVAHSGRELFPSGQGGPGGLEGLAQTGRFTPDLGGVSSSWRTGHQARWIAEDAVRRFTAAPAGTVSPSLLMQAYVLVGYTNRTLGENMCEAVFDGGPIEPNARYFERAEAAFTKVVNEGSGNIKLAALAGRAGTYVWLKKWAEAATDAAQVPLAFNWYVDMDGTNLATENAIFSGNMNQPVRAYSINFSSFYDYYNQTGDPRVAWRTDARYPFATSVFPGYGPVPWSYSLKYKSKDDDIRLAGGTEAVLIRAEAILSLTPTQWPQAMALINSIHTAVKSDKTGSALAPLTAISSDQAWAALKRERGIELYMEGRRMGDIRRWKANNVPGALDFADYASVSSFMKENPPSDCMPIPDSERDVNPNF